MSSEGHSSFIGVFLIIWISVLLVWGVCFLANNYLIKRKTAKVREGAPVIGYKYANLSMDTGKLTGVSGGIDYNTVDYTSGRGFHSFKELKTLVKSGYRGELILEVLLYGEVKDYRFGYIATNQRVLQVSKTSNIRCSDCNKQKSEFRVANTVDNEKGIFCTKSCTKIEYHGFLGLKSKKRIVGVSLEEWIQKLNEDSENELPVKYLDRIEDIVPTVIKNNTTERRNENAFR